MLKFQIDVQNVLLNAVKYKKQLITIMVLILIALISTIIFFHFQTKKKALISGQIAVGFAYLDEGKKETALYHFEQAFNKSDGFYKVIAGVGVIKSISDSKSNEEKILNVLALIKNHTKNVIINNLINAVLISNQSAFQKEDLNEGELKKFETFANKSNITLFKEALMNIYLNLNQKQQFETEAKKLPLEVNDKIESNRKFNLKERILLLKTI